MLEVVIALVLVAIVAAFVAVPLRRRPGEGEERVEDPVLAELEARKQAKYREIRDTEQDHAQGKLTDAEFKTQDAELRREAIAILRQIDEETGKRKPGEAAPPASGS